MGLLPGDRFGEADAGAVPGHAGRPGSLQSLPDPGAPAGGRLARRHRRGHRADLAAHAAGARVYYEPSAVAFTLVWLPGLVLAATGRYWIGPYTLAVLPLTLVVNAILYRFQRHRVFNLLGLRVRRNALARPVASYSGGGGVSA